jgi:hypothetical protein
MAENISGILSVLNLVMDVRNSDLLAVVTQHTQQNTINQYSLCRLHSFRTKRIWLAGWLETSAVSCWSGKSHFN